MGSAAAIGGGALLGFGGQYLGARAQDKATRRAIAEQRRQFDSLMAFQQQVYGDSAPFRNLSFERFQMLQNELPGLLDLLKAPSSDTVSPAFRLAGREGLDLLRSGFATSGDPGSGAAGIAAGRFMEGLGAQEAQANIGQRNFLTSGLLSLLGGGGPSPTTGTAEAVNLMGQTSGPSANISNLLQSQGAVTGGLYGSFGNTASQLGLLYGLGAFNQPTVS